MTPPVNRRVLLIDDMPAIHEDFRKILCHDHDDEALDASEALLFGAQAASRNDAFALDCASGGEEGLAMLRKALRDDRPYAVAFVDMRMPAGWDGVRTIEQLWRADARLQVVVCTAYADYSWDEMLERLQADDRMLILKKPFDTIEVLQLASALTRKWSLMQQVESRMAQADKLAAVGQLAAGVAHEINNPLGYVQSNFGVLEQYVDGLLAIAAGRADAPFRLDFLRQDIPVLLAEARDGVERVSRIVKSLKDFARVDMTQEWTLANLRVGLESTLSIMASELRKVADVRREYGAMPDVECLPSQMNQVAMNLLINAAHAIGPERGCITVRTGGADGEAWFEVQDTGCGIPDEVLPNIFDPFFTTKPVGKGTGLGLSVSYGIVRRHGGRIDVRTAPRAGSTFRVTLPVRQRAAETGD